MTKESLHSMVQYLFQEMAAAANSKDAPQMQSYMKTDQPFYGIKAAPRRKIFRRAAKQFSIDSRDEYGQVIRQLWNGTYREDMYQALEVAERYKKYRTQEAMPQYEYLANTATNWDTLDWIAGKLISDLVRKHRGFEAKLKEWRRSDNMWLRRTSLLAHKGHREETHTELLGETILMLSDEEEFFIRKAIGWILRDYSYANPDWVEAFVDEHEDELSGLSKQEALKKIKRVRQSQTTC